MAQASADTKPLRLACITGGDDRYFLHLLLLIASLRRHAPGRPLHVCDFGLSEGRRAFVAHHARLLPLPASLVRTRFPWDKKAALLRYMAGHPFDALLWLDTDAMLAADAPGELEALAAREDAQLYCCAEPLTLAGFIAQQQARPDGKPERFVEAIARRGVPLDRPYLNSGVFLCRSRAFLQAWDELTQALPMHVLYEQNAFNLIAHGGAGYRPLESVAWNCVNADLDRVRSDGAGGLVADTGERVRVIHCTTNLGNVDVLEGPHPIANGRARIAGMLRAPRNPAIRALQQTLLDTWANELGALGELGLLEGGAKA